MNNPVIYLQGVTQTYGVKFNFIDRTEERKILALKNINLIINKGETIAVLGPNGSGKTTLLKIIAGLLSPDRGKVNVHGKVRGIFELGAGLIPELSGYQNIEMMLKLYGEYSQDKIQRIIEFSELGDFIYAPVKIYSQGMYLRLAFSVAINTEPEILIVDDILAVGDTHFQKKCLNKIKEIISEGKTLLIVTHNFDLAQSLCSRAILIEKGEIIADGPVGEMRPFFDSITGNLSGIGMLKNERLCFIFNNGRGSIIFDNQVITNDLGMFVTYSQNGRILYSTDFKWQIKEETDGFVSEGKFDDKTVLSYRFFIQGEYLKLTIESPFPRALFNLMLREQYSEIRYLKQIVKLPPVNEIPKREWDKILDAVCDNITIVSQDKRFPYLSLSFPRSEIIMYNHNFYNKSRIFQAVQVKSNFNLIVKFCGENPGLFSSLMSKTSAENLFSSSERDSLPVIFRDIRLVSYQNKHLFLKTKQKTIKSHDFPYKITKVFELEREGGNIFFSYQIQEHSALFSISADCEIKTIQGLDFCISPYYDIYRDSFGERRIQEGEFQNIGCISKFLLQSIREEIPDLDINLNPEALLLVKRESDFVILRFLFTIDINHQKFEFNYERSGT